MSLQHGSIQLLFVTKIKEDVHDVCITWSPLIISAPNAELIGPYNSNVIGEPI